MKKVIAAAILAISVAGASFASDNAMETLKTVVPAAELEASQAAPVPGHIPATDPKQYARPGLQTYVSEQYGYWSDADAALAKMVKALEASGATIVSAENKDKVVKVVYIGPRVQTYVSEQYGYWSDADAALAKMLKALEASGAAIVSAENKDKVIRIVYVSAKAGDNHGGGSVQTYVSEKYDYWSDADAALAKMVKALEASGATIVSATNKDKVIKIVYISAGGHSGYDRPGTH